MKVENYFIKKFKLKNRQGSVLAYVLIMLLISSIFTLSILHLVNTNTIQIRRQQDRMEAYYLAYSGVEMAFTSLLADNNAKLKELRNGTVPELKTENIEFGNGKISVTAETTKNENFENWIEITSTANLNKNDFTYTRKFLFDPNNPIDDVWLE